MVGELVYHYNDNEYRHHFSVEIDMDKMECYINKELDDWWEPCQMFEEPYEGYMRVHVENIVYSAIDDYDDDGYNHLCNTEGEGNFFVLVHN